MLAYWAQERRTPRSRFAAHLVAAVAFVAACTASASDYEGSQHLRHDGWEHLNVLATTLNERCVSEDLLGRLIEARFRAARTTPAIAFRSQFANDDGAFDSERWYEHIRNQLYLKVAMRSPTFATLPHGTSPRVARHSSLSG